MESTAFSSESLSFDVVTLFAAPFSSLMGHALDKYIGPRARAEDYFDDLLRDVELPTGGDDSPQTAGGSKTPGMLSNPRGARTRQPTGTNQASGSASTKSRDEATRQTALRVRRRVLKASVEVVLGALRMSDFPVEVAVENKVKPSNLLQRDRFLICTSVAEAFAATVPPGVGESDLWSLPVLSILPFLLHGIRYHVLLDPNADGAGMLNERDDHLVFDPAAMMRMLWTAVGHLGVEARPPFASRFSGVAAYFLDQWMQAQTCLLQHVRDIGSTVVGTSLFGAKVADVELSVAVRREVGQSLPYRTAEERVSRLSGLSSGLVNVHVRSWRTAIIDVRPRWCLSATWMILFAGGGLVAPSSSPFSALSTARSRSVARSYADLAKRLYATDSARGRRLQHTGNSADASGARAGASRSGAGAVSSTLHSEHDQDSVIIFLEQVSVFVQKLVDHPLLSLGALKRRAFADAAAVADNAEARALLVQRVDEIAVKCALNVMRACLLSALLPASIQVNRAVTGKALADQLEGDILEKVLRCTVSLPEQDINVRDPAAVARAAGVFEGPDLVPTRGVRITSAVNDGNVRVDRAATPFVLRPATVSATPGTVSTSLNLSTPVEAVRVPGAGLKRADVSASPSFSQRSGSLRRRFSGMTCDDDTSPSLRTSVRRMTRNMARVAREHLSSGRLTSSMSSLSPPHLTGFSEGSTKRPKQQDGPGPATLDFTTTSPHSDTTVTAATPSAAAAEASAPAATPSSAAANSSAAAAKPSAAAVQPSASAAKPRAAAAEPPAAAAERSAAAAMPPASATTRSAAAAKTSAAPAKPPTAAAKPPAAAVKPSAAADKPSGAAAKPSAAPALPLRRSSRRRKSVLSKQTAQGPPMCVCGEPEFGEVIHCSGCDAPFHVACVGVEVGADYECDTCILADPM